MARNKTKHSTASVTAVPDAIDDQGRKADARKVAAMMHRRYEAR